MYLHNIQFSLYHDYFCIIRRNFKSDGATIDIDILDVLYRDIPYVLQTVINDYSSCDFRIP